MSNWKKVAVVAPLDFTSFLCNKYLVKYLVEQDEIEVVYVLGQKTPGTDYVNIIESWGATWVAVDTPRHISILKDLMYLLELKQKFSSLNVDIVINMTTKPNVYGPLAARSAGVKYVFTGVWGRGTAFTDDKSLKRMLIRTILKYLLSRGFKNSDLTWITNPEDYEYLINKNIVKKEKAYLTKNYVDTDLFSKRSLNSLKVKAFTDALNYSEDSFVVTLVGRMIWPKGIREFAEASELLQSTHPRIKFLLVGAEEHTSPDRVPTELLENWSRRSNFDWVGYQEDILSIYGATDLAVLPSYYKEGGYPRALTEPMSLSLPVITSDSKDCREPVIDGYNGFRVPVKNSQELARRVAEIADNNELQVKFGENSRKRVLSEYSEKVIMEDVVAKFRSFWR